MIRRIIKGETTSPTSKKVFLGWEDCPKGKSMRSKQDVLCLPARGAPGRRKTLGDRNKRWNRDPRAPRLRSSRSFSGSEAQEGAARIDPVHGPRWVNSLWSEPQEHLSRKGPKRSISPSPGPHYRAPQNWGPNSRIIKSTRVKVLPLWWNAGLN